MAGFDFIDSTSKAYGYAWRMRADIARLCGAVVLFKVMSFITVALLGIEDNALRQGLLLLPSYFLEGWAICLVIAMAISEARGVSYDPAGQKRNAVAGAIVFTLIKLVLSFLMGMAMQGAEIGPGGVPEENSSPAALGIAVFMIAFVVWTFRFLWLYIPVALGYGMDEYLSRFRKFSVSFYMIGAWILCFVPFALGLLVVMEIFRNIFSAGGDLTSSLFYTVGAGSVQALFDFAVSLVSSLAMAYGIYSVFCGQNKPTRLF